MPSSAPSIAVPPSVPARRPQSGSDEAVDPIGLPGWVAAAFGDASVNGAAGAGGAGYEADAVRVGHRVNREGTLSLTSCVMRGAGDLGSAALREGVSALYGRARGVIASGPCPYLLRVWQFIPGIHGAMGGGLDRYMVFNQGRFDGFCAWPGGERGFRAFLPAATGVGHGGVDLWVHFLSGVAPGRAVENPRQRPAFEYSAKFGPRPPCFARATVAALGGRPAVLIAGTASIRGEETVQGGSLDGQVRETVDNLAALMSEAGGTRDGDAAALSRVVSARVYFVDEAHRARLERLVTAALPRAGRPEMVRATICRTDLLVEIEGVGELPAGSAGAGGAHP